MKFVIKILGTAQGSPHWTDGSYIKSFDPAPEPGATEYDGGTLLVTRNIGEAMLFDSLDDAIKYWHTQAPPPFALRDDGEPNKPLTAFSVTIFEVYRSEEHVEHRVEPENAEHEEGLWIQASGLVESVLSKGARFSLGEIQKFVGGYIEITRTRDDRWMWVNEDGMRLQLPTNLRATQLIHPRYLVAGMGVVGNVLVVSRRPE